MAAFGELRHWLEQVRWFGCVALVTCHCAIASATELQIGQATVPPGALVSVPVTIAGASGAVATQFDINFSLAVVSLAAIDPSASLSGHVVYWQEMAPGHWRALAYSMTNGPISPGTIIWLRFNVSTDAPDGIVPLGMTNAIVANVAGQPLLPLMQVNGALIVSSAEHLIVEPSGAGGQLRTTIIGLPGRVLTLQGSPDLFHWANLGIYTNETGTLLLTNPPATGRDAYFYRTIFRNGGNPPLWPAPSLSDAMLSPNDTMRFHLISIAGSAWRIQGSPDLYHWGNYGVVTNPSGTLAITNAPFMKPNVYFFRAAQP